MNYKHKIKLTIITISSFLILNPTFLIAASADRSQPIRIDANNGGYSEVTKIVDVSGNVSIIQGSLKIAAHSVVGVANDDREVYLLTAKGSPVRFQQNLDTKKSNGQPGQVKGQGNVLKYDKRSGDITINGNAKLNVNGDMMEGSNIFYNVNTENYSVKSSGKKDRVSIVIYPKNRKAQ